MSDDQVLPHDLAAERAVLGALLLDAGAFDAVAAVLRPEHMYRHAHRCILAACFSEHQAGRSIDFLTVRAALERAKHLETVSLLYLSELVDGVPRATNVGAYAGIVREKAEARAAIEALQQGIRAVHQHGASLDVLGPLSDALRTQAGDLSVGLGYERRVGEELGRERARREARRRLDAEDRGRIDPPAMETLAARLARPRPPQHWRIDGWHPLDARTMTTAAAKTGKSTLAGNRIRSLVDGDPFLGAARVATISGAYVLLDTEMSEAQCDDWLGAQRIRATDRVYVVSLRGKASAFNILDPVCRAEWAARFRDVGAAFLDQDGLRPILDAIGLDEHKDAGRYLVAFDALLAEAAIRDANVTHHMGHGAERARGDSRLRDWPDVEIRLTRESDDARSARYIAAYGRDVDISESKLDYDPATRRLTLAGGSRRDAAARQVLDDVIAVLAAAEGPLSGRQVKAELEGVHSKGAVDDALKAGAVMGGEIRREDAAKNTKLYSLSVPVSRSVPRVSQDTECSSVPAPIRGGTRDTRSFGDQEVSRVRL